MLTAWCNSMAEDNELKLYDLIANVLEVDKERLSDDTTPNDIESWDSFNGLMLVSELEEKFQVSFSIEETYEVRCIKDIRNALIDHGISFE